MDSNHSTNVAIDTNTSFLDRPFIKQEIMDTYIIVFLFRAPMRHS